MTQAACSQTTKFYVDCGQTRTASAANLFCLSHQMTMANLTNGTASLISDIALLNTTFLALNCIGNFWYSSGSQQYVAGNTDNLGGLLSSLLTGVLCLIPILCPATTTAAPITNAFTVCTRPVQQHIIQKCSTQVQQYGMQQFLFNQQSMQAGVLDAVPSQSLIICSGICSSNNICVGMSFNNGICTLYM